MKFNISINLKIFIEYQTAGSYMIRWNISRPSQDQNLQQIRVFKREISLAEIVEIKKQLLRVNIAQLLQANIAYVLAFCLC